MVLWQNALLIGSVLFGGALAWSVRSSLPRLQQSYLPLLLAFSGAYLLGIAAMELMPTIFSNPHYHTGVWVLAGFFVQLLLEGLSQGVEHGHVHTHEPKGYGFALAVMVGLGVHAFLEGLPLGARIEALGGHHHEHTDGSHLLMGIVLHKIPAAFALTLLLRHSGYRAGMVVACLLLFALLSPLGALTGEQVSIDPLWTNRVLALVVGSFLHISTTIIFESDGNRGHGISLQKFTVVVLGMAVAWFTAH